MLFEDELMSFCVGCSGSGALPCYDFRAGRTRNENDTKSRATTVSSSLQVDEILAVLEFDVARLKYMLFRSQPISRLNLYIQNL